VLGAKATHQHFTRAFFVKKFAQSQTLSREKLLKRLLYVKCARKMLMKLTPTILVYIAKSCAKLFA